VKPWLHTRMNEFGASPDRRQKWVLLSYHLPREPSTPRIALWRRLRRLGVAQLGDGLVALPADSRTREQLEWLAQDVTDAGGSAGVWLATSSTRAQEHDLASGMSSSRAREYTALAADANAALDAPMTDRSRTMSRLRRQWREINRRDFFPPPEREEAASALRALGEIAAAITESAVVVP
jgi:hypothetical protein